jgi:hypothetical protein
MIKHALTEEVAYNSVRAERRWAIHEQKARGIETLYATCLDDHCVGLAHHDIRGNEAREAQLEAAQGREPGGCCSNLGAHCRHSSLPAASL